MDMNQINKAVSHLHQGTQVPAPTAQTPLNDGDLLTIALRHKFIRSATDDEISEALKYCMAIVGIRANNLPTPEEKALLLSFIRRHFSGNTVSELKLAFDMAVSGKFGIDARSYENFSCIYLVAIMEPYREWAAMEIKQLKLYDHKEPSLLEAGQSVDWTEEWDNIVERAFSDDFITYFIPTAIYTWLEKKGEISLSAVDKWGYVEKARVKYISDINDGDRRDLPLPDIKAIIYKLQRGEWKKDLSIMTRLNNMAKELIVKDHAKKCAKQRTDSRRNH
jgi:hypothetical protein